MLSKKLYLLLLFCIVVKPTNDFLNQVSQLIGENKTAISVASLAGILGVSYSYLKNRNLKSDQARKATAYYALTRFRAYFEQQKKNAFFMSSKEDFKEEDFLKAMLNFENRREEIWSQISRFGKGFPTAYVESLKENQVKINKDTGVDITLEKVYEFLGLDNCFAKSLPHEVVIEVVDLKLENLKLQGTSEDKTNILGRQLKWIFKNEFAKENYDAFIFGTLESLVFEDQETYEKLNRGLENIIEAKNAYVELHKLEEKALYGELKKAFVDLIKSDSCIKKLIQHFSGYSPNFWVNGQASATIKSIIRGALAAYAVTHSEDELSKKIISKLDIENKKDQIIRDIIIYCFALAVYKNQGFSEGSFILQGSNVSQIYQMLSSSGFVRLSSHFKGLSLTQYGLDIADLPEHKTHILFAEIAPNIVFVKPENYGVTGISNLIGHSYEFIVAQACKLGIWGSDQAEGMRKERVPAQEFSQYKEIVNKLDLDEDTRQAYVNNAALVGLQEIYKKLQSFEVEYSTDTKLIEDIKALKSQLTSYDHIDKRFGQEVILTDAELSLFSPELLSKFLEQEL